MQEGIMLPLDSQRYGLPKQYRSNIIVKDHLRENVRRLRQIQRNCKEKETEAQKPVKALWKSDKYSSVTSKIKEDLTDPCNLRKSEKLILPVLCHPPPQTPRPSSVTFLRAHSRSGPTVRLESRPCTPDPSGKVSVPTAAECTSVNLKRHNIDFIRSNGMSVKHQGLKKASSVSSLEKSTQKQDSLLVNYQRGEVPKYLRQRQAEWQQEEEERVKNTPDPNMPLGHRVLPEEERKETLDLLRQKEKNLNQELQALPMFTDTYRVRSLKKDLETKIAEVEEAIKIFSRPKVFIKVE